MHEVKTQELTVASVERFFTEIGRKADAEGTHLVSLARAHGFQLFRGESPHTIMLWVIVGVVVLVLLSCMTGGRRRRWWRHRAPGPAGRPRRPRARRHWPA